jgi:large subunit ribosomal protein L17
VRHNVYGKHLSRDKNERTALFKNLVRSLILSEKIQTTEPKAKAIKGLFDKIVNQAKAPSTKRLVSQYVVDKDASSKLIKEIAPRLSDRNSGYTRVVKLGKRLGDGAMIVQMSLVEGKKKEIKEPKESEESKEPKVKTEVKKEAKPKTKKDNK